MSRRHTRRASAVLSAMLAASAGADTGTDDAAIVHVLNRLAYGPRAGDVEKVRRQGLDRWIEEQLRPERIDDGGLERRLAGLRTLTLSTEKLFAGYEVPPEVKREAQRRRAELGDDATEAERERALRELRQQARERMEGAPRQVVEELQEAKLLRAVYSERQLDEVLADFWLNHFNVFAGKGPVRLLVVEYERDVIRKHAWGRFEDLLRASARSPAMLFYLDNWLSADPGAADRVSEAMRGGFGRRGAFGRRARPTGDAAPARRSGLNENYARELMELHTLGVDGGYTQKDVTEVARAFTGWTIAGLRKQRPEFRFQPLLHDRGDKVVLGQQIKSGGQDEGERILRLLATHPSTARFVSYKLARRLVADEPPTSVIERAAAVFRKTDGNIRDVVRSIVMSPEFLAPAARQAKVKTPLEFTASALRASGAEVSDASSLTRRLAAMGMPLYMQQPPTGYKDTADAWVSTGGLLARLNLALDLAAGRVPGVRLPPGAVDGHSEELAARLLPAGLSEPTRETLRKAAPDGEPARVAGLLLGSPEFQRR